MFWSYYVECVVFLIQKRSGVVSMDSTHEEDQTAKQGLYHPKMNDTELITCAQYVLE